MTQEQRIRRMLEGFIGDPPDSDYQEGFLAAVIVIASEIMGIDYNDRLLKQASGIVDDARPDVQPTLAKVFKVIEGGKPRA